jgi:hypothetical protein
MKLAASRNVLSEKVNLRSHQGGKKGDHTTKRHGVGRRQPNKGLRNSLLIPEFLKKVVP